MNGGTKIINNKYVARGYQGNGDQTFLLVKGGYGITRPVNNSGNRIVYHAPIVYTASSAVTTGKLLENPLYYAAKYGSFNDADKNNVPTDSSEWDVKDINGNAGADGIPDNFFPIRDPSNLAGNLGAVLESIAERISSGTAAAVVANSSTGLGAVYQAYYHPIYTDVAQDKSISWGGVLHSMFIDESGRFREDNGTKGKLDDVNTDYVVDIRFATELSPPRTVFQRYTQVGTGPTAILTPYGLAEDLGEIHSIWNARNKLAEKSELNILSKRKIDATSGNYGEDSGDKR
jgi:type IV pilus assembly protein PilY1